MSTELIGVVGYAVFLVTIVLGMIIALAEERRKRSASRKRINALRTNRLRWLLFKEREEQNRKRWLNLIPTEELVDDYEQYE